MKKKVFGSFFVILLFVSTTVYAHGGNISGYNDKDSDKIIEYNREYYGYHKENDEIHYHKVQWNEEKQKWQIKNSSIYYDENFNIIKDNNTETKKVEVTLNRVIDGDTVVFNIPNYDEAVTVRFLAVNTPETTSKVEPYGKEASEFTKEKLTNSKKIVLEYDNNSTETDKYNRQLAWVWVDDELLQELLIENGLAKVDYIYGNYKYVERLEDKEEKAKSSKIGIWQDGIQEDVVDTESNITIDDNESGNIIINLIFIICGMIILGIGSFITKIKNRIKEQRKIKESEKREKNGN